MFDFEVAGVADKSFRHVVCEGRLERAVFVESDFVAGCDECGVEQDRDRADLHSDGRKLHRGVEVVEVDASIGGCFELFDDCVPGNSELGVGWLADLPVAGSVVATVDAGGFENGPVHRDFGSVAFEAELLDSFVVEHGLDE